MCLLDFSANHKKHELEEKQKSLEYKMQTHLETINVLAQTAYSDEFKRPSLYRECQLLKNTADKLVIRT